MRKRQRKTLRQLIEAHKDDAKVTDWLFNKDSGGLGDHKITRKQTLKAYSPVIAELLSKPQTKPLNTPIYARWANDGDCRYIDVCFRNPNFVKPQRGAKPWGGPRPPKGHYNCNAAKYNEFFAFGYTPWSQIIDTKVEIAKGVKDFESLAAILWNLTYHGWTEKDCNQFNEKLNLQMTESWEEIQKDLKNEA